MSPTTAHLRNVHGSPSSRKLNGSYYTSQPVAEVLVEWALDGPAGPVLDPSFGGCAFLHVALQRLATRGVEAPARLIYGVDIDPATEKYRRALTDLGVPGEQLLVRDFFATSPSDLGDRVSAVVGNPPYIRHHLLGDGRTSAPRQRLDDLGVTLDARADLWAYFVAHATSFLAPGGRMALLLPGAALHAAYAQPLFAFLEKRFDAVELLAVRERFFEDALERSVVLTAASFEQGSCTTRFFDTSGLAELRAHLQVDRATSADGRKSAGRGVASRRDLGVPAPTLELYAELAKHEDIVRLGSVAQVRLGVVTGANRFFVRRPADARRLEGDGVSTVPVVSRSAWLQNPRWTADDQRLVESEGRAARLLVIEIDAPIVGPLEREIDDGIEREWDRRSHCQRRERWYSLSDVGIPSAFLPYMGATAPCLILNTARATSTNAVHRVSWTRNVARRGVAGSWTSLFALAAEIHGRSYGGGVLKLEPGEIVEAFLPLAPGSDVLSEIDEAARTHGSDVARCLADERILVAGMGLTHTEVGHLRAGVEARVGFRTVPT